MSIKTFNESHIQYIRDEGLRGLIEAIVELKGVKGAKLVQRALNSIGADLKVDGWLGSRTIRSINRYGSVRVQGAITNELSALNASPEHNLSKTSLKRLKGVHPDIVKVVKRASLYAPIFVAEGLRSQKRQNKLVKKGKSQSTKSYHLYGLAVDLVLMKNGKIDWNNKKSYKKIYKAITRAEKELFS
jgi:peptidoglycan L-alanyl-D-glutamate endopeptidase CwlK